MRTCLIRILVGAGMASYGALLAVAGWLGPRKRPRTAAGVEVLLTGQFYSNNWIAAHLGPMCASRACARVRVVTTFPIEPMEKLEVIIPPAPLRRLAGDTGARLLVFLWTGLRRRHDYVGGFHLLINGLLAQLLARMSGARAVHFCVGGPAEFQGGGINSENRVFEKLKTPSPHIEARLIKAVRGFDLIITMGTRAKRDLESRGVRCPIHVVSGGLDAERYRPGAGRATFDLIFVGRLAPIKRVDLFLDCVQRLKKSKPDISAVVVGDGQLRAELESTALSLGIAAQVRFAGAQANIENWLGNSRIFMLTSDSEGLSLALIEAMLCGLPAVVSDVGDLGDLVQDGRNGYLVTERDAEPFAARALELLQDQGLYERMSGQARQAATRFELGACARQWDQIFNQD